MSDDLERIKNGQQKINGMIQKLADTKKAQAAQSGATNLGMYDPISDGPFDTEKYVNSKIKIMFICKEPNSPADGGWDYKDEQLKNDYFFGSMNNVANRILNGDTVSETGDQLSDNAAIRQTAFTNVSNLPGGGSVGQQGSMDSLYNENAPILEAKLETYSPDIIVCGNVGEKIWPSIEKSYGGIQSYTTKYFDNMGNELSSGEGNATAVYYCVTKSGRRITVVDARHPGYIKRGQITQDGWVKGIINAVEGGPKAFSSLSSSPIPPKKESEKTKQPVNSSKKNNQPLANNSRGNLSGGVSSGNGGPINPRAIAIIIGIIILIILLLLLLRNCKSPSSGQTVTVTAPPPVVTSPPVAPQPPELFSERTEKLFVKDSSELLPPASSWLDDVAHDLSKHIEQNPDSTFQVIGYAAVFPGLPDPGVLSLERANKIISELVARKINANKLQAVSGGETNRWGHNIDESGRAPNRRIVIQQRP